MMSARGHCDNGCSPWLMAIQLISMRCGTSWRRASPKLGLAHPAGSLPAHPHKSAHRLHASVVVPTYLDIPSDSGLTPQHNSLAHNIKLYAERLPMFRAH